MEEKAGAQISQKSFFQSFAILLVFMIAAGILTLIIPAGSYTRIPQEGREMIDPLSFRMITPPEYPIWRWFTAPVEVLAGPDSLTIITIIIFLLMVGIAFAVLDKSGILKATLNQVVRQFSGRKYILLLLISFFFMSIGAFFGIFEEVVPLVPLMILLAHSLGWDTLTGLGMSILATNMGFSAAITNPFTLGVAQRIAGLPLFSGAWFRIFIFIAIYIVMAGFLFIYARSVDKQRTQGDSDVFLVTEMDKRYLRRSLIWLGTCMVLILVVLFSGPLLPAISDYSLPIVGVLFFTAGIGAGLLSGTPGNKVRKAVMEGAQGIAPAIPLILMAASVKHIVSQGEIIDTILHQAAVYFQDASSFTAVIWIYLLALIIEFFVPSGSAKAFLLMPLILPLSDLVGVTRQLTVTAYCFGDGFSNLAYPTNPVLLICLGLARMSFGRWLRWTIPLWLVVLVITIIFLHIGFLIGFGPF